MADNENVKIRVDSAGVEAQLDSASAKKFGELVSPFTSLGRVIGDRVSLWGEIWNFEYAINAAKRAHELASREGIPIEVKSPKLLKSWAVNASLEDNSELADKWAMLLLNSSTEFRAQDAINISILSKLGSREATFLDAIWDRMPDKHKSVEFLVRFSAFMKPSWKELTGDDLHISDEDIKRFRGLMPDNYSPLMDENSIQDHVIEAFFNNGFFVDEIKILTENETLSHSMHAITTKGDFLACRQLGLLSEGTVRFKCREDDYESTLTVEARIHGLTDLGVQFLAACRNYEVRSSFDEEVASPE